MILVSECTLFELKFNGIDDSGDGGDKHLINLSQVVDCCLMERSNPNSCVDDGKEGVDESADNSADDSYKRLTHLTQVENNVYLGDCDKHLTCAVKNTP
eukprot:14161513-Ditylum_brightwellii.AAC.1